MNCKICSSEVKKNFKKKILNKYDVQFFHCNNCGFLFTEEPYWLAEAYNSAINISDTGILDRNIYFSKVVSSLIYFFFDKEGVFLDYAGGYGIFTRLMRDIGFDFYWSDKYSQNLLARGFEYKKIKKAQVEALTAFEVFEHLVDPLEEINKMLAVSENIFFSTKLLPEPVPEDWWYFGFNHGQHIAFYSRDTLTFIANKNGLRFYSFGEIHLFTRKKINPFLFSVIVKLSKYGIAFFIAKIIMKSKMWGDHVLLEK